MSQFSLKGPLHHRKSLCGATVITESLKKQIAMCNCEVLQPLPEVSVSDLPSALASKEKSSQPIENFRSEEVLLPSATMTLCLWKDEKEYHLTVFRLERNELFLDLPLSGVQKGKIAYNKEKDLWHEVTIIDDVDGKNNGRKPQRLAFNLKSSVSDRSKVKKFNRRLETALEETLKSAEVVAGAEWNKGRESVNFSTVFAESCYGTSGQAATGVITKSMATAVPVSMTMPKAKSPLLGAEAQSMSPGLPYVPLTASAAKLKAEKLQAAILAGNVKDAQEAVMALAQGHVPVNVTFDSASHERMAKDKEISVTVHVEDREAACDLLERVRPSDTILDLKHMFFGKHNFPVEVQKWIIGNRICSDEDTLNKCQVNTSGHTLYLYLLNARAVNLSHEEHKRRWQARSSQDLEASNYSMASTNAPPPPPSAGNFSQVPGSQDYNLTPPQGLGQGQISPQGSVSRMQSQMSAHSSAGSLPTVGSSRSLSENQDLDPASGQRMSFTRQGQGDSLAAAPVLGNGEGGGGDEGRGRLQGAPELLQGLEEEDESAIRGWRCEQCTLINEPTRPGCEVCGGMRPANYKVPANYVASPEELARLAREQQLEAAARQQEFLEREKNYQQLLQAESSDLVTNIMTFSCPICFDDIQPGEGIVLRECLHHFCKDCLTEAVRLTEEAELKCPFQDEEYSCNASLQNREVRALVPDQIYERYLRRSLDLAESQAPNSFHCKTPDCRGWCIFEDLVNFFKCPVCSHENCMTCRAIHEGLNCKQYQEDLRIRAANDKAALQTQMMLQEMVEKGDGMHCPKCQVIVQKKDGCDWIRCSICKTEICWVTKGPRWGPNGEGDTSGGCLCRVNGRRCHPKCNNCH